MITAAEKAWLGFTPIAQSGVASLIQLWRSNDLPGRPEFDRWSAEFAREVWVLIRDMTSDVDWRPESKPVLVQLLTTMGCWSEDPADYQWVPKGWSADAS